MFLGRKGKLQAADYPEDNFTQTFPKRLGLYLLPSLKRGGPNSGGLVGTLKTRMGMKV